jgi:hypothetical protein
MPSQNLPGSSTSTNRTRGQGLTVRFNSIL